MMYGSKSARDKLKKTGGTANVKKGANKLKKTASNSAYSKLMKTSTRKAATDKLKKVGGGAAKSTKNMNPKAKTRPSTKAMTEYQRRMKAGQRKSNLQRKSR